MNFQSAFQSGPSSSRRFLSVVFSLGIYFSVLVLFINILVFSQIRAPNGDTTFFQIAQLPHTMSLERANELRAVIGQVRGVSGARIIPEGELVGLLELWVSETVLADLLPFPHLIEISGDKFSAVDRGKLDALLGATSGGHLMALPPPPYAATDYGLSLWGLLLIVLLAFALFATGIIAFLVIKIFLLLNGETIDILRLLGAADSFIASQVQPAITNISLVGASVGAMLAVGTVGIGLFAGSRLGIELFGPTEVIGILLSLLIVGLALGMMFPKLLYRKIVMGQLRLLSKPRW